jgi:hypothetical protein
VSAKKPDIALIRKYLNGELDARAMFELERQAEADPFLWDMIKGMEAGGANDPTILSEIDALIDKRVEKDKKRIIPLWTILSIAASLFVALGIGGWWLMQRRPEVQLTATNIKRTDKKDTSKTNKPAMAAHVLKAETAKTIAKLNHIPSKSIRKAITQASVKQPADSIKSELAGIANPYKTPTYGYSKPESMAIGKNNIVFGKSKSLIPDSAKQLNEISIRGYATLKKAEVTGSVATIQAKDLEEKAPVSVEQALSGRLAGVAVQDKQAKSVNKPRIITGVVVDIKDNSPIPGASVMLKDKATSVVTDINGRFSIKVPANSETLVVNFIGYTSQQVNVKNKTDLTVSLSPNNNSLSEVVVVGYGTTDKAERTYEGPHPSIGWDSYDKYMNDNATMPNGATGVVRLAFTVNKNGAISNIIVKKGETPEMNQKAIDLLKNGPGWVAANDGEAKVKRLRVKFHK